MGPEDTGRTESSALDKRFRSPVRRRIGPARGETDGVTGGGPRRQNPDKSARIKAWPRKSLRHPDSRRTSVRPAEPT